MAATPWEDDIKTKKVLTVFATPKVTGPWLTTFNDAIAEFNRLSKSHNLGVTLSSANATKPDPVEDGGAEVQFDLGKGKITYDAFGQSFVLSDREGKPINFSPTELHGATQVVRRSFGNGPRRVRRAFVFVPETPMVNTAKKIGPGPNDYTQMQRAVGSGMRLYIAVHEFVHACGIPNDDHNVMGPAADVFTIYPQPSAGTFDKPEEDKFLLHLATPQPNVFSPPIFLKKKIADMIRDNWK